MTGLVEQGQLEFTDVLNELEDFVYWLASRDATDIWLMDQDELEGELFEEMWKGFLYYREKIDDMEQMKAVLRRMFDNRIRELRYKYAVTHRKHGINPESLDRDNPDDDQTESMLEAKINMNIGAEICVDVDEQFASSQRVLKTREMLEGMPNSLRVFDAVIYGNPILKAQVQLSGIRAMEVFKTGGTIKIKPYHVANALPMPEAQVRLAFRRISRAYEKVCETYG